VLFPAWFFQGVENMKYITVLNVIAKLIFTVAIFVFIQKQSDYIYVALLNSLGFIIAGIIAIWIIFNTFNISFTIPSMETITYQLRQGWHIFISTIAISLYTISNTFILGLLTNNTIVGYYAGADKILKAIQGIMGPVNQSVYPYMSKLAHESREKVIQFAQKLVAIIGALNLFGCCLLFILSNFIVTLLLGGEYSESVVVLRIMSFLPFIVSLSNIFGIQIMLPFGYNRAFSNILISASVLNIILLIIFVPYYQHIGTAVSVVITEIFVTMTMYIYLFKKQIKLVSIKHV
jgi:PST family polysaccharide transporter